MPGFLEGILIKFTSSYIGEGGQKESKPVGKLSHSLAVEKGSNRILCISLLLVNDEIPGKGHDIIGGTGMPALHREGSHISSLYCLWLLNLNLSLNLILVIFSLSIFSGVPLP